jgi:hypothetical protein
LVAQRLKGKRKVFLETINYKPGTFLKGRSKVLLPSFVTVNKSVFHEILFFAFSFFVHRNGLAGAGAE